jgi:hypothetical protein
MKQESRRQDDDKAPEDPSVNVFHILGLRAFRPAVTLFDCPVIIENHIFSETFDLESL